MKVDKVDKTRKIRASTGMQVHQRGGQQLDRAGQKVDKSGQNPGSTVNRLDLRHGTSDFLLVRVKVPAARRLDTRRRAAGVHPVPSLATPHPAPDMTLPRGRFGSSHGAEVQQSVRLSASRCAGDAFADAPEQTCQLRAEDDQGGDDADGDQTDEQPVLHCVAPDSLARRFLVVLR